MGGLFGYDSSKVRTRRNVPSSKGVSASQRRETCQPHDQVGGSREGLPGPKMTAFQSMMLSGHGLPEIPEGGSVESLLKSRIKRLLQFVDCREYMSVSESTIESEDSDHREKSCTACVLS